MELNITQSKLRQNPKNMPEIYNLFTALMDKANTHTAEELWLEFKTHLKRLATEHILHEKHTTKHRTT